MVPPAAKLISVGCVAARDYVDVCAPAAVGVCVDFCGHVTTEGRGDVHGVP